ncbi:MAG: hypothetical protein H8E21_14125 [Gammaproteobacteria bacterium]|nr:hypothetical protein [Gammaproteobacteria bacterium]MBL6998384.1 hypothetical protein [Gammaproteobacteria bacterium]
MNETIENGFRKEIDGVTNVYYEGYWIKCYKPPTDNLSAKKKLIQSLTRRLFNHMEHGINIPGRMLDQVRAVYEAENDPKKKRVKGAMLAGALFNRGADIFTHLVDLEASGVKILPQNDLMHTCGLCLREALEYGKLVKHRNGDEGIDELWGEPFKAFVMTVADFYESRYLKIALTMRNIDEVAAFMVEYIDNDPRFKGLDRFILNYAKMARRKCEILRTDDDILDVWSEFVVAGEEITNFIPDHELLTKDPLAHIVNIKFMLKAGVRLIAFITRARTPMPKSSENFYKEFNRNKELCV